MDGREGEEDLFEIIQVSTVPVGPNDGGDQDDGSQYLNDSCQGMEEEEQLQGPDVEADKNSDEQAIVQAVEPTASTSSSKKSKRGPAQQMSSKEHLISELVFVAANLLVPLRLQLSLQINVELLLGTSSR